MSADKFNQNEKRLDEKRYKEYVRLIKAIEGRGKYTRKTLHRCEYLLSKASLEQILKAHEEAGV